MWFRNIRCYKFEESFKLTSDQLHEALMARQARPCGQMETVAQGWVPPLGRIGSQLVHEAERAMLICLRREEKLLPASLVREQVAERVFQIEQSAGRPAGRREKSDLKEQVLQELMPRALARSSHTFAAILPDQGWLLVDAASAGKAEALLELLRKSLGSLPVVLPSTEESPEEFMTRWLLDERALPEGFALEDECELHAGAGGSGIIRCRNLDVSSAEVKAHATAGLRVKKLAMNWRDSISFVLHDDLSLRRLRFDAALLDEANDAADDEASRFDADLAIMAGQLKAFLPEIFAAVAAKG